MYVNGERFVGFVGTACDVLCQVGGWIRQGAFVGGRGRWTLLALADGAAAKCGVIDVLAIHFLISQASTRNDGSALIKRWISLGVPVYLYCQA